MKSGVRFPGSVFPRIVGEVSGQGSCMKMGLL